MLTENIYSDLYQLTDDLLADNHQVKLKVGGFSMFPFLRKDDIITLCRCDINEVHPGDIVVFKTEKKWIAHRLIKITSENGKTVFICRGDNSVNCDSPFTSESFVGKVLSFNRNGKEKNIEGSGNYEGKKSNIHTSGLMHLLLVAHIRIYLLYFKSACHISALIKSLKFITQKSKGYFYINIIIAAFQGIIPFVIIYLVKLLIDGLTAFSLHSDQKSTILLLTIIIILTGAAFLISSVLGLLNGYYRERLSQSVSNFIYNLIHRKHADLSMAYLEDSDQQDKIHRAIQEASFRPQKLLSETMSMITTIVSWLIIMAVFIKINWIIFVLLLIAVTPGFFVRLYFTGKLFRLNKSNSPKEREAFYYNRILTGIPFAKEIRLFGLGNFFNTRFYNIQNELHGKKNKILRKRLWLDILAQTFTVLLIFLSFAFVVNLAIQGTITAGSVVLFFLVFQRGFTVLKELFQSLAGLFEDSIFLHDFFEFLNLPLLQKQAPDKGLGTLEKGVIIKNISFKYPSSQRMALESVSLELPAGKTTAIVGANGSGKTTLVKLLCGFYSPDKGQILFDGIDISDIPSENLRKEITVVFQDFALYNLTAAENIALGDCNKPVNIDEIKKAAKNAGMDDVIEKLPNGYNTLLGNLFKKGEELSIGQWQKMAIAKAFYRDTSFLILDEPSSALDIETESNLLQNLSALSKDKTVLIISHRFSSIKWVDRIYVMDQGKVIESGSHQELMEMKKEYFRMFELSKNQ
jgi:ATP-binding cassette, subfamily B, bacterial